MTDVQVSMDEHVKRHIVVRRLQDFYRQYCPKKLPIVDSDYSKHHSSINDHFSDLLRRYPQCPRDFFKDVTSVLTGLQESAEDQAQRDAQVTDPASNRSHMSVVAELLQRGEELLQLSPPRELRAVTTADSSDDDNDDVVSKRSGGYYSATDVSGSQFGDDPEMDNELAATSDRHLSELRALKDLVDENHRLSQEVALAEQQVLQKRFEISFFKLVIGPLHDSGADKVQEAAADILMTVEDGKRVFQIPCTPSQQQYVIQGPLAVPLTSNPSDYCKVSFTRIRRQTKQQRVDDFGSRASAETDPMSIYFGTGFQVVSVVMAMAMRVWSRSLLHTITEVSLKENSDEVHYHPSTTFWWQWPSPCEHGRGVAPEQLFSKQPVALQSRPLASPMLATKSLHHNVVGLLDKAPKVPANPDFVSVGASDQQFWTHFLDQYEQLVSRR